MTIESPDSFDADYVKGIRQEAAKYRTEAKELKAELEGFKGLEAQMQAIRIENEFIRRGINAEPQWVQFQEGETPSLAVDRFLEKYPQFQVDVGGTQEKVQKEATKVDPKEVPGAMPPKQNIRPNVDAKIQGRDLSEIKQDPVARTNLTDMYRDLLKSGSNLKD